MVTPRLDAVEEMTVTGATPGAGSGPGAVQIAFTTRSGTNEFNNSIYHYFKHPSLNSNYYFNKINGLEKNEVDRPPVRRALGRADRHPGAVQRAEQGVLLLQLRAPPPAERGDAHAHDPESGGAARRRSRYLDGDGVHELRTVDLLEIATRNGQTVDARSDDRQRCSRNIRPPRRRPDR